MTRLADVADVIRSKNAGPYGLTLDIIFAERFWFEEALRCELISSPKIGKLYGIKESDVLSIVSFPPCLAIKATLRRPLASGAGGDTDITAPSSIPRC